MNGIKGRDGFLVKLSLAVLAIALPFAEQALAAGTTAGTDVVNLATVDYDVNGNDQEDIESAPGAGNSVPGAGNGTATTFEVDNRVDFTLTQVGAAHTIVSPGDTDAFVEFLLTNNGNASQDFRLAVSQLGSGDGAVNTLVDTDVDMNNLRIRVGNGGGVPVLGDLEYADELAEDASVTVYVFGDADVVLGLVNGDVANLELTATVAESGTASSLGADLVDDVGSADDPATVDIVFADGGGGLGDGIESDRDGFEVQSAGLNVSKVATVIDDPFNGTTNPKAIPGATVEYVITITNSGTLAADNVSIADSIDTDVNLITDFYAGQDVEVVNDGAPVSPCNADAGDGDTDGCALDGQDLTIGNVNLPITVAAGTSLTVTYRVTIP